MYVVALGLTFFISLNISVNTVPSFRGCSIIPIPNYNMLFAATFDLRPVFTSECYFDYF